MTGSITRAIQHEFPQLQKLSKGLFPRRVLVVENMLLEIYEEKCTVQLQLRVTAPVKSLQVLFSYGQRNIEIVYLIHDSRDTLQVISRVPTLKVISTVEDVAAVALCDLSGLGHPQLHIQKSNSSSWEQYDVINNELVCRGNEDDENETASAKLASPLNSALETNEGKLKSYQSLLEKKRLLRAKIVSDMNPRSADNDKALKIFYCKCFFIHGRYIQIVKFKTSEHLECAKIALLSPKCGSLLQTEITDIPAGAEKILVCAFAPSNHCHEIRTQLACTKNGVEYFSPLPDPSHKTVMLLNQHLKSHVEDCQDILLQGSLRTIQMSWFSCLPSTWSKVQKNLKLEKIAAQPDGSFLASSIGAIGLEGMFLLAEPHKQQATFCFRDDMQLQCVKELLGGLPISFKQHKSRTNVGVFNDLKMVARSKSFAKKKVSLFTYFQILQELIRNMDAFAI